MALPGIAESCTDHVLQAKDDLYSYYSCPSDNTELSQVRAKAFALNYVSDAVIQYDINMNIIWVNKAASVLSGLAIKELIRTNTCRTIVNCPVDCDKCPVKSAYETGCTCTIDFRTEDDRTWSITALPFMNTSGTVDSVIEIIRDKTHDLVIESILCDDYSEVTAFSKRLSLLTNRENEVLLLVVSGKSNKNISEELGISPKTIEIHRSRVMLKLKADSLASLVRWFTLYKLYKEHRLF